MLLLLSYSIYQIQRKITSYSTKTIKSLIVVLPWLQIYHCPFCKCPVFDFMRTCKKGCLTFRHVAERCYLTAPVSFPGHKTCLIFSSGMPFLLPAQQVLQFRAGSAHTIKQDCHCHLFSEWKEAPDWVQEPESRMVSVQRP